VSRPPAIAFCVPIRGNYHETLFPELADTAQSDLFQVMGMPDHRARTPGNTIRKVYLCRAQTSQLRPGAVLYFYRSSLPSGHLSQSLTTVGVVEKVSESGELEQLVRLTAKRSVYTTRQLSAMIEASERPIKVIDFLLVGHLDTAMYLPELLKEGVFRGPPQSISMLSPQGAAAVNRRLNLGFAVS
jgi:hypothetical protein